MLAKLYQKIVLKKPNLILVILLICLCFFGYYSKNFRLDASSETLFGTGCVQFSIVCRVLGGRHKVAQRVTFFLVRLILPVEVHRKVIKKS